MEPFNARFITTDFSLTPFLMKFKRPVIKQMLSEEIIIANSQLHDKMLSPILPVHHHTKALMRRPHTGFTFVGTRVNYYTGISEAHKQ